MIDKRRTGQQIQALMKQNGLSANDVKDSLHVGSVQCVYQWLNGKNLPTVDNLYALGNLFGVGVDGILCEDGARDAQVNKHHCIQCNNALNDNA